MKGKIMRNKRYFNIFLITASAISIVPANLFSMQIPKKHSPTESNASKQNPNNQKEENRSCLRCRELINAGEEASSITCHHGNQLHGWCASRNPIACRQCNHPPEKPLTDSMNPIMRQLKEKASAMAKKERRKKEERRECFICNQRVFPGTEATSLRCRHRALYHERCINPEPCEYCRKEAYRMPDVPLQHPHNYDDDVADPNCKLRIVATTLFASCLVVFGLLLSKWCGWR